MICVLVEEIVGGRHEDGLEGLCRAAADRQRCQHCVLGVCVSESVCGVRSERWGRRGVVVLVGARGEA